MPALEWELLGLVVPLGVFEADEVPVLVSIDCLRFDCLAMSKLFFLFAPLLAPLPLFVPLALDGRLLTAETAWLARLHN